MPIVEVNGQEIEFPDSMSNEEIRAVLQRKFPTPQAEQESTLAQRLKGYEDYARAAPDPVTRVLRTGASGARQFGDIVGTGLSEITPQFIKEPLGQALNAVGSYAYNLPTGTGKGESVGKALGDVYSSIKQAVPQSTQNLEDALALTAFVAPMPKIGKATKSTGKAIKETGTNIAKFKKMNADDVAKLSGAAYKRAKDAGGVIKSEKVFDYLKDVYKTVDNEDISSAVKKVTARQDKPLYNILDDLYNLVGEDVSLNDFQKLDEFLGDAADDFVDIKTGKLNKTGKRVLELQTKLREMVETATDNDLIGGKEGFEALKEGRELWRRQAKLRDIEKIIERAEMTDNPATSIRTGFRTLATNPNKLRGFTKEEVAAIKKAARGGPIEFVKDLIRPTTSRLSSIVALGSGNPAAGAVLNLGGMTARGAVDAAKIRQAENIGQLIARGGKKKKPLPNRVLGSALSTAGRGLEVIGTGGQIIDRTRPLNAGLINLMNEEKNK